MTEEIETSSLVQDMAMLEAVVVETSTPPHPVVAPTPDVEIVPTWLELRGFWRIFTMSEWIMRDRLSFFEEVRTHRDLGAKLRSMILSSLFYLGLFGVVLGMSHSWMQALMSAIKLPMLFLVTLLICLPTLYFFNLLYGSQLTFQQTTTLMMAAVTITGALSLAFASISLFFWLTIGEQYTILILLNVIILGISSWWGLSFLRQGMRHVQRQALDVRQWRILTTWLVIYAFVGTQMAWALRPFFGVPAEPFVVLRSDGGTFVGSMLTALGWLLQKLFGY